MDQGSLHTIAGAILVLVPMILSLTVHEFAHAWMGKRLGDTTAEELGRLTLNPLPHIDPIGTLLLPLLLMTKGLGYFGWAKPVPFNPARFRRDITMRTGTMLVALAGPVSNLLLALASLGILSALVHTGTLDATPQALLTLLTTMIGINIGLFVFNMIPVAPLDGQKILAGLLPGTTAIQFDRINARFGWIALLLLLAFGGELLARPVSLIGIGLSAVFGLG